MKIINEAQKQISLKQTSDKHEKFIFHMKNKLLGICMFYLKLTICIHIPNIKRVYNMICMKARDSWGIHVYLLDLNTKYIYMK